MFTISVVRWPPRYFSEMHTKIRRDAKAMIIHGHVPNVKRGGKVNPIMKERFQDYVAFTRKKTDKTTFLPAGVKTKKAQFNVNESFGGSVERWDSQKAKESGRKKDNYIKSRPIDHDAIIQNMNVPFEILKITGSRRLLADPTTRLELPEVINLNQQFIQWLLEKNTYVPSEVVDCGLLLIDKKLNEDSNMTEPVIVYTSHILRLIFQGVDNLVQKGKFLTVMPRDFGIVREYDRYESFRATGKDSIAAGSHFTLVSNFGCESNEVNIYETFAPYRSPDSLLTKDGVKLVKSLAQSDTLKVNCVNVQLQDESECGPIAIALAVQLCSYQSDPDEIYYKMKDVRRDLYRCFKDDQINYFTTIKKTIKPSERLLFSIDV